MSRLHKFLLLATIPLVLSGCKTVGKQFKKEKNAGPCPAALVLWDASRKVEIHGEERYENVGFTAEVMGTHSFCKYFDERPITADLDVSFAFGRGPAAEGDTHTYTYFVSVVRKNLAVIEKKVYTLDVRFPAGQKVVTRTERFSNITIPRASANTSGNNFEIIVGLQLTPEELAFARSGKRFRFN